MPRIWFAESVRISGKVKGAWMQTSKAMRQLILTAAVSLTVIAISQGQTPAASPTPLRSRVMKYNPQEMEEMSKAEVAATKKGLAAIHWSRNADPAAAADEDLAAINAYCSSVKGGPRDLDVDLITQAEDNYQPGNDDAAGAYFARMNKDLEKQGADEQATHLAKAGPSPDVGGLWGVSLWVHDAIKAKLRDPDSYKFISVRGPWPNTFNGQDCWFLKVLFRAKNEFGGYMEGLAEVSVVVDDPKSGHETVLDVQLHSEE
jgi:hypothetical protein